MLIVIFAVVATIFGFAPTGLVALAHGLMAWSAAGQDKALQRRRRQSALLWCWISVGIGAAVELPVVATLIAHSF